MIKGDKNYNGFFVGFKEEFTEEQFAIWEEVLDYYIREEIDGKRHVNTVAHRNNMITIDYIREFYNRAITNYKTAMTVYDYGYINMYSKTRDIKSGINFTGFSFTLESLQDDIYQHGVYEPLLVSSKIKEDYLTVLAGRHRIVAINELHKKGLWLDKEVLYFDCDGYKKSFEVEFILPTRILEMFYNNYPIEVKEVNGLFSTIIAHNIAEFWMFMKLQEKELDLILEKYMDEIVENNILPADFIVREINSNSIKDDELTNIVIQKIRNKKNKEYVTTKFGTNWSDEQKDTWEMMKLISPRVIIDGKVYFNSILYTIGTVFDKNGDLNFDFISRCFHYFYKNIEEMTKVLDYEYLDFKKNEGKLVDLKGSPVTFEGYSFTLDSLRESIYQNGVFFPMSAYKYRIPDKYVVCGGRHKLIAINSLIAENKFLNNRVLCFFWDSFKNFTEVKLTLPTVTVNAMLKKLDLPTRKIDDNFSEVTVNNHIDFWIIIRAQEKDLEFLLEKYPDELEANGIRSSNFVNITERG